MRHDIEFMIILFQGLTNDMSQLFFRVRIAGRYNLKINPPNLRVENRKKWVCIVGKVGLVVSLSIQHRIDYSVTRYGQVLYDKLPSSLKSPLRYSSGEFALSVND
jgi:hypothetical protein